MTKIIEFPKRRPTDLAEDLRRMVSDWKRRPRKTSEDLLQLEERLAARLQGAHREVMSEVLSAGDVGDAAAVQYDGRVCRRVLTYPSGEPRY